MTPSWGKNYFCYTFKIRSHRIFYKADWRLLGKVSNNFLTLLNASWHELLYNPLVLDWLSKVGFSWEKGFLDSHSHVLIPWEMLAWDNVAFTCLCFLILLNLVFFLCCLSSSLNYEANMYLCCILKHQPGREELATAVTARLLSLTLPISFPQLIFLQAEEAQ